MWRCGAEVALFRADIMMAGTVGVVMGPWLRVRYPVGPTVFDFPCILWPPGSW
jgi:hypothetical protein